MSSAATFQIIGGYDRRTSTGTIASPTAHQMTKRKRPASKTWAQVRDRALGMDVTIEKNGRTTFLTPPSIVGGGYYSVIKPAAAWAVLDRISAQITAAMPNEQVFALAAEYKTDLI